LFFWRRFARLYPIHAVMLGLMFLLVVAAALAGVAPRDPGRFARLPLVLQILLQNGWGFADRWAWNYPSWSISTEWAGYLLFPLLLATVRGLSARTCWLGLAVALAALSITEAAGGGLNLSLSGPLARFFPEFIAGMLLLGLIARQEGDGHAWLLAGVLGLAVALAGGLPDVAVVAALGAVLAGLARRGMAARMPLLLRVPGLHALGLVSYAFYMSLAPAETMLSVGARRLGIDLAAHAALYAALNFALTLTLGGLAYRLVERPAQRRLGRLFAGG
jgi:peptidoglycan/LPS O-acetylase OafA/YrhL